MNRYSPSMLLALICGLFLSTLALGQIYNEPVRKQPDKRQLLIESVNSEGNCEEISLIDNWYPVFHCGVSFDNDLIDIDIKLPGAKFVVPPRYEKAGEYVDSAIIILPVSKQWRIDSQEEIGHDLDSKSYDLTYSVS